MTILNLKSENFRYFCIYLLISFINVKKRVRTQAFKKGISVWELLTKLVSDSWLGAPIAVWGLSPATATYGPERRQSSLYKIILAYYLYVHSLDSMYNILALKLNNSSLFYFIPNNETCLQEIKKLWEEASLLFCFYYIFYEFCKRRAWCLICLRAKKDEKNLEETFFEKGCAHFLCA